MAANNVVNRLCDKRRWILGNCRLMVYQMDSPTGTEVQYQINDLTLYNRTSIVEKPSTSSVEITVPGMRTVSLTFGVNDCLEIVDPTLTPIVLADFDAFIAALSAEQQNCDCCD